MTRSGYKGGSLYGWTGNPTVELHQQLDALNDTIEYLIDVHKIDSLAFSGSSGAAAAFYLAFKHKLGLVYVRKIGENSHGEPLEVNQESSRCVIVDDFVATGATIRHIISTINAEAEGLIECVGIVVYDSNHYSFVPSKTKVEFGPTKVASYPMFYWDEEYEHFALTQEQQDALNSVSIDHRPQWYRNMVAARLGQKEEAT